jgi:hypothetical protein
MHMHLQAIFDDSFTIIAARPHLTLKLSLAQPGTSPEDEGPPSRLFTLLVTLPEVQRGRVTHVEASLGEDLTQFSHFHTSQT